MWELVLSQFSLKPSIPVIKMRIDSCRNCGSELKVIELCPGCDQPLHYQCENCRKFVEDPIHLHGNIIFS